MCEAWRFDHSFWEDRLIRYEEQGDDVVIVGHRTSLRLKKALLHGMIPREEAGLHVYGDDFGKPLCGLFFSGQLVFYFDRTEDAVAAGAGMVEKPLPLKT